MKQFIEDNSCDVLIKVWYEPDSAMDKAQWIYIDGAGKHISVSDLENHIEGKALVDAEVINLVNEQAEDEGLWFIDATASEAYLQQALRRLHAMIEEAK